MGDKRDYDASKREPRKARALMASCRDTTKLRPWQRELALWAAEQGRMPPMQSMVSRARVVSRCPVTFNMIRELRRNPTWVAFYEDVEADITARAKEVAVSRSVEAVKAHFDAIQELVASGQHKDVSKFTNPIIDRVWPKQAEGAVQTPLVQINFGAAKPEPAEAEIVSIEEVPPDA